jgi:hypothetical protein
MYYGGNHIENWASCSLTNRYADGSNLYSDGLRNEPKASHLAAMHYALAEMNDALLSSPIVTRAEARPLSGQDSRILAYEYGGAAFVSSTAGHAENVSFGGTIVEVKPGLTFFASKSNADGTADGPTGDGDGSSPPAAAHAVGMREIFYTDDTSAAESNPCNKTYTPLPASKGALNSSKWEWWIEPIPLVGGSQIHSTVPLEQLDLTHEKSQYMYYQATLPASSPEDVTSAAMANLESVNLTMESVEGNAFVLWLDGKHVGGADDHTKGGKAVNISIPVPPSAATRDMVLLSVSLGISNFPGTDPAINVKGIVGKVMLGGTDITPAVGGWINRPVLSGELLNASSVDGGRGAVHWTPHPAGGRIGAACTWYRTTFLDPRPAVPVGAALLLEATGLSRGHFWVNGHDLGRIWPAIGADGVDMGTSQHYYIPQDTLVAGENTFVVFDELGAPLLDHVRLVVAALEMPLGGGRCPPG